MENPQPSNKSNDGANKANAPIKSNEDKKVSSTVNKDTKCTKNTETNKASGGRGPVVSQSAANKAKVTENKSEVLPETSRKLSAKSTNSTPPFKGQQKKANPKENVKSDEKSTTAKSTNDKGKIAPKATSTTTATTAKAKATATATKSNKTELSDILKKMRGSSIADTAN